jgi:hypothetical protein
MRREEVGLSNSGIATTHERKWRRRTDDLLIELIGWALTTALGALIGSLLTQQPIKQALSDARFWMFAGIVILFGGSVIHLALKSSALKRKLIELQEQSETQNGQLEKFNIQQIYPNRETCKQIIQEKIRNSETIKLFLLIGSDFVEDAGIFKQAFQEKPAGNAKVKIMIAAPDSPFFSEKRINYVKNDKGDSRRRILSLLNAVEKHLDDFKKQMRRKGIAVDWRKHKETFLCKLHLFDDCAIFCFNIVTSDNDNISPYFIVQKNKNSIYHAFEMYFDFVWSRSEKPQKAN